MRPSEEGLWNFQWLALTPDSGCAAAVAKTTPTEAETTDIIWSRKQGLRCTSQQKKNNTTLGKQEETTIIIRGRRVPQGQIEKGERRTDTKSFSGCSRWEGSSSRNRRSLGAVHFPTPVMVAGARFTVGALLQEGGWTTKRENGAQHSLPRDKITLSSEKEREREREKAAKREGGSSKEREREERKRDSIDASYEYKHTFHT